MLPEFRAKCQSMDKPSVPVVIPALSNILCSDDEDVSLCPVRALRRYIRFAKALRTSQRRLFISLNPKYHQDIKVSTLSRWLVHLVKDAYAHAQQTLPTDPVKAHELRAISSSLALQRSVPVSRILAAASWKSSTTFISHYLRDVRFSRDEDGLPSYALVLANVATSSSA